MIVAQVLTFQGRARSSAVLAWLCHEALAALLTPTAALAASAPAPPRMWYMPRRHSTADATTQLCASRRREVQACPRCGRMAHRNTEPHAGRDVFDLVARARWGLLRPPGTRYQPGPNGGGWCPAQLRHHECTSLALQLVLSARVVQLVLSATEATSLAWRVAGSLAAPWGRERTLSTENNNSASALVIGKSRLQDR